MIENSNGAVLDLDYSSILSLQPLDKKMIKVIWIEDENAHDFVFSYENPDELTVKYKDAYENHRNLLKTIGIRIRRQTEQIIVKNPVLGPRFEKIPHYVTKENIWNDCWLDQNFNLYVTHNKYLQQMINLQNRPHQIEYKIKSKDDKGVVVKPQKVHLKFGIPAVQLIGSHGKKTWFLLPTMNKNLITNEIECCRHLDDPEKRIEYVEQYARTL